MPLFDVTYKLVDDHNGETHKTWAVDELDHATAVISAADMATKLAALTELRILQHTVKEIVADSDSVTVGANVDEGATFSVRKPNNKKDTIKVPGPMHSIRNADRTLDITSALVTDFINLFITGNWTFSQGEVVSELLGGTLDK